MLVAILPLACPVKQSHAGALHGLTTWAFTTLLVLYLLTSTVGSLVGGVFSGLTTAVGGVGQTVAQTAAPIIANSNPLDALECRCGQLAPILRRLIVRQ